MGDGRIGRGLRVGCEWDASGCINPPSILTLYASPVKSYGGGGRGGFLWGEAPFGLSNVVPSLGGGTPLDYLQLKSYKYSKYVTGYTY